MSGFNNKNDVKYMKKIQKFANVIPILAKGDSYTKQEIIRIKQDI